MIFCRILYVGLLLMGLGVALAKHGEYKSGRHNFWVSLIGVAIDLLVLYGGGFFD